MFGTVFLFTLIAVVTVLVTRDAVSIPQIGAQFGEIHNNGTGGGNLITPYGDGSNSSGSVPGSGYPGGYYGNHSNESSPTSPSMSGSSLNLQNSSLATSGCDCSQVSNVAPTNAPTDSPSDVSGSSDPASGGNPSE